VAAKDSPFNSDVDRHSGPTHCSRAFESPNDLPPRSSHKIPRPRWRSNQFHTTVIASTIRCLGIRVSMAFHRHVISDARRSPRQSSSVEEQTSQQPCFSTEDANRRKRCQRRDHIATKHVFTQDISAANVFVPRADISTNMFPTTKPVHRRDRCRRRNDATIEAADRAPMFSARRNSSREHQDHGAAVIDLPFNTDDDGRSRASFCSLAFLR
jgi:hypothetical protein